MSEGNGPSTLIFFSLFFWKRQGKPTKLARIFCPCWTPKILGKEGKNAQKSKEFQNPWKGKNKKQGNPKNARKRRAGLRLTKKGSIGKCRVRKKGSFGKGVFSEKSKFSRDSRKFREFLEFFLESPPDCGKQRRIRPFSRASRESIKAGSLQCGFWPRNSQILIWKLPWIFGWIFSSCSFQGNRPEKSTKKSTAKLTRELVRKNSPRISAEAFSWEFLEILEILEIPPVKRPLSPRIVWGYFLEITLRG